MTKDSDGFGFLSGHVETAVSCVTVAQTSKNRYLWADEWVRAMGVAW